VDAVPTIAHETPAGWVKPGGLSSDEQLVPTTTTGRTERTAVGITSAHARDHVPTTTHPAVRHAVESMLLEERTRWAMQIHDGLTQSVTSAVLEIQTLRHRIESDPEGAMASLKEIEDEIREDLRRIRELLFEMTTTDARGAEPTLAALVRDCVERWNFPATVETEGDLEGLPDEVLEAAYAIVTEGLANAAKHSGAPDAHVSVRLTGRTLRVEVEDRGRGVAVVPDHDPHFGVRNMRTRAEKVGGSLEVESTPGRGTIVVAVLPVGGRGDGR
jgi:signal transduction histidine kinase